MPGKINHRIRRIWVILWLAVKKFLRIDGAQWAGAFAFNAFLSLFPLIIFFVSIASAYIDRDRAVREIIVFMGKYVPISAEIQSYIFGAITGVVNARGQASAVSFLILIWVGIQCFTTLICVTNRAWGTVVSNWWRLPLKSLALLGIAAGTVLLCMAVPLLLRIAKSWLFAESDLNSWVYTLGSFFIPLLVMFFSLTLFYMLAPHRPKRFAEVWVAALCTMALMQAAEGLFVIYLKRFARLNAVYGAFGGFTALLLWIYLSGCIFIFGACLCAAQSEGRSTLAKAIMTRLTDGIEP